VVLLEENEEAADVYMMCRGQVLTADIGQNRRIVTLSVPAVKATMDAYKVKDQKTVLGKVMKLWHAIREQDDGEN
jgi:hypothetical protein